jgi:hypothetical protein
VASHLLSLVDFLELESQNKTELMSGDLDKATAFLVDIQNYIHLFIAEKEKPYLYEVSIMCLFYLQLCH